MLLALEENPVCPDFLVLMVYQVHLVILELLELKVTQEALDPRYITTKFYRQEDDLLNSNDDSNFN